MDSDKVIQELLDGQLGDLIRERLVKDMLTELESDSYDDDREWADGVAEWLRDNWN